MNQIISLKDAIAYTVFAYATLKEENNKVIYTCEELARKIIDAMNNVSIKEIKTKVKGISVNNKRKLTRKLAVAYAIIAYATLKKSANRDCIDYQSLINEILVVMDLYIPKMALQKADYILINKADERD